MLVLAGCAAVVSMSFALLSLFGERLPQPNTGQAILPTTTASTIATGTPSAAPPVVQITRSPNQLSSSPTPTLTPEAKRQMILNDTFRLRPRRFRPYRFVIKDTYPNARATGYISASGGGGDDIYIIIVDDQGLRDFESGNSYTSYFRSKVFGSKNIKVNLPPGVYHAIVSNSHARFFAKLVEAKLYLEFD
jgi:hypothetical protein